MFTAGDVVRSKINGKLATVVRVLESSGLIRVRFDGAPDTIDLHPSRFEKETLKASSAPAGPPEQTFKKGDYIQITDGNGVTHRGAALSDIYTTGLAGFDMLTDDGEYLSENANYVNIVVLFRADIARGQMPKY